MAGISGVRPGVRSSRMGSGTLALLMVMLAGCGGGASDIAQSSSEASVTSTSDPATTTSSTPPSTDASAPTTGTEPAPSTAPPVHPVLPSHAALVKAESQPVEDPYYPQTSNPEVDALHYFLDLDWDGQTLTGVTTLTFRAARDTDTVRLDLSGALLASDITLDGDEIDFDQADVGLTMDTGALERSSWHTLTISYSGTPHSTPAPSLRSDMTEGLGWNIDSDGSIYTFQEPYGAFTWYPVNDHPSDKALYDAHITTRDGDVGVFNGHLESSTTAAGTTTDSWQLDEPAASYLVTLAIGPYQQTTKTAPGGMDVSYWLLPRDKRLLPKVSSQVNRAFPWLVRRAGPYPFSTLGVVVVGGSSAMETQTLITVSRDAFQRPDAVMEHELAHEWFGDTVSPRDWQQVWLNEGWAMYLQQAYERATRGYRYGGGLAAWRALDRQSRRTSGPPGDYNPQSFGDLNIYLGPAMMLDEIRQRLGNKVFGDVMEDWPADHENSSVSRADFTRWLTRETGHDFTPLMHRWLDAPVTPKWTP